MDQLIKSYVDDLHTLPEIKKEYDAIQGKLHFTQKVATLFCTLECGEETEAFLNGHSEQKEKLESRVSELRKKIESIQSTSVDFVGKLRLKATESNEMAGNIRGYIRDLTESAGEIFRKIQKNLPTVDLKSCSLEALNEQISVIQNKLCAKKREVNEYRNKLLPIEKEVLDFKTELDECQGEVNNLQERLDSLSVFSFSKKKNLRSLLNDKKDELVAKTDLFKERNLIYAEMLEKLNTKNDEYTKEKSILKSLQEVVDIKLDIIKNTTLLESYMDFTEKINSSLNDKNVLKQLAHDPFVWNELKKDTKIFKILTDDLQTLTELANVPELLLEFKKDINILKLLIKDEKLLKELVKDTLVFEELKKHNDTLMLLSNNTDILKELVKDHSALETLTKNNIISIKQQIESGAKTVLFGNFQQTGARYDPIAWRVLDKKGDKILLISEFALYCNLTDESFLQMAFTGTERELIKEVEHSSYFTTKNIYSYIGPYYYEDGWFEYDKCEVIQQNQRTTSKTKTKIFSLNIEELEKYFPSQSDRKTLNTKKLLKDHKAAAKKNETTFFSIGKMTEKSNWFLDSTVKDTNLPTDRGGVKRLYINTEGAVEEANLVVQKNIAFRPAMWVNINY